MSSNTSTRDSCSTGSRSIVSVDSPRSLDSGSSRPVSASSVNTHLSSPTNTLSDYRMSSSTAPVNPHRRSPSIDQRSPILTPEVIVLSSGPATPNTPIFAPPELSPPVFAPAELSPSDEIHENMANEDPPTHDMARRYSPPRVFRFSRRSICLYFAEKGIISEEYAWEDAVRTSSDSTDDEMWRPVGTYDLEEVTDFFKPKADERRKLCWTSDESTPIEDGSSHGRPSPIHLSPTERLAGQSERPASGLMTERRDPVQPAQESPSRPHIESPGSDESPDEQIFSDDE
ncbi:unnamed protein product [Caenorhabditis auriculariae]|uniref:Uncharacterized protein n=1 Tax=Caenorhabditis auriculariae TaxID=2777116 RepID=A0A8S1GYH4_9PELO|nr:unnamed protein product [Caenorhabditis auriculariae]